MFGLQTINTVIKKHGKHLVVIAGVMLIMDMIYLKLIGGPIFTPMIRQIQGGRPMRLQVFPAALVYLVMVAGLYYFIIKDHRSIVDAALLGMLVYLVYDLTNKATLTGYTWTAVMLDGVWGGILFALTTSIVYYLL